jgi:peptidoglycan/xylan/chitin deacetylase (PgdA/CDA1 family)
LERNFHSVSTFREHLFFLRHQPGVQASELAEHLLGRRRDRQPIAVITFDDGYANNLLAAEILSELKAPWTLFVSTGAVGRDKAIWTVELSLLLLHGHARQLDVFAKIWSFATREQREAAFQDVRYRLKAMPAAPRRLAMQTIRAQFPEAETERLLELFPSFRMLTWTELRYLASSGVEIGSHGVHHEIHHSSQDPEIRKRELVESKAEIQRQIGRPCRFFAFPNGNACEDSQQELQDAGYELGFTTRQGFIRPGANRFLLPRLSPGGSLAKLKQQLRELR